MTSNHKKATDSQLITAYKNSASIYKVAEQYGMCAQSVHERLQKLGVEMGHPWTKADDEKLRRSYVEYRAMGKVSQLADEMGRTRFFLSRKAKDLGLTSHTYEHRYSGKWKYMDDDTARMIFDTFRKSSLLLGQFCEKYGYDKLGFTKTMRGKWPDEYEAVIEAKTPRQTKYRLGREIEYRVRDYLKANGFIAMRSPASKTPIDVMAVRKDVVLMVQCKRGGALPPKEWNALMDVAKPVGAMPVMAERPFPRQYRFWRLDARKDGSRKRQPMTQIKITETSITAVNPEGEQQ